MQLQIFVKKFGKILSVNFPENLKNISLGPVELLSMTDSNWCLRIIHIRMCKKISKHRSSCEQGTRKVNVLLLALWPKNHNALKWVSRFCEIFITDVFNKSDGSKFILCMLQKQKNSICCCDCTAHKTDRAIPQFSKTILFWKFRAWQSSF